MSRVVAIITFALFLMNCQSTPIGESSHEEDISNQSKEASQAIDCLTNNQSEECMLTLETIDFELPELRCDPYEIVVDVQTAFFTPAGLGDGSTSRIDWEFLPKGNAGFWISSIEQPIPPNSKGTIAMSGCFIFGDQSTLRIKRTIIDQLGNVSNELTIDVEDPNPSKIAAGTKADFMFAQTSVRVN